jgi:hypothetical protein
MSDMVKKRPEGHMGPAKDFFRPLQKTLLEYYRVFGNDFENKHVK